PDARPDQEGSFPAHSVLVLKPQDGWQRPLVVERSARCIPGCLRDLAEELLESRRRIDHQALCGLGLRVPPAEEDASRHEDQPPSRRGHVATLELEAEGAFEDVCGTVLAGVVVRLGRDWKW